MPKALDRRLGAIARLWCIGFVVASLPKLAFSPTPIHGPRDFLELALPYWLVALAPVAGYRLAAASFPAEAAIAQPGLRLAVFGKWRRLTDRDARSNPLFGPAGFMASLLIGLLLNVGLRSVEFLLAVPALNYHAPAWGTALFRLMALDVAVMSFFYTVCFVMALRTVPLFPRMLLFVWALDVFAQLLLAHRIGAMAGLPHAVAGPFRDLLTGNIYKVLISALVWLPYLILSDRVNLTYRQRTRDR